MNLKTVSSPRLLAYLIAVGMGAFLFTGCDDFAGLKIPEPGSACSVASDQEGTLFAPLANLPVKLYIDPTFSPSRKKDIRRAASQWNRLFQYSLHKALFEVAAEREIPGVKNYYSGMEFCGENVDEGVYVVAEHSVEHWTRMGYSISTAGVTNRCSGRGMFATALTHPHIVVYLNSAELSDDLFFGVALHEFGHVLGLDHSCTNKGGGYAALPCASIPENNPYRRAIMKGENDYRAITNSNENRTYLLGTPMVHLEQNDIDRSYCLYQKAGLGAK
ncbi:MAG: hypothetical protein HY074_18155 [Deltaproteobacteria bacterium]|nr:hypothetical protein [Deltaproteobacteria bacterium]